MDRLGGHLGSRGLGSGLSVSQRRRQAVHGLIVLTLFSGVALWRHDLFAASWRAMIVSLSAPGPARWRVLGQGIFLAAIFAATLIAAVSSPRPARDALGALAAAVAGWSAEAWGTRLGLWSYYTGERPPLWIVPAWPLGALVIERAGRALRERFGPAPDSLYAGPRAACLLCVLSFCAPRLGNVWAWAGPAAVAASLWLGASPAEEGWTLAAGLVCVFFADTWGTSMRCWSYYMGRAPRGWSVGVVFGMAFDTALVIGCLRLADACAAFTDFSLEFSRKERQNSVTNPRREP